MGRFPPYNKVKICRHGIMVFNPNDAYLGRSLDLYGEFAEAEIGLLCRTVEEGSVVLDVGACIGTHTLPLAKAVGPTGTIHSFEPQRLMFQTLCANIALNSITNVFAHHAAIGDAFTTLFAPKADPYRQTNFAGFSLRAGPPGEPVPAVTIDALGPERVNLIKIDVEGMERSVIEGATETIGRFQPVLYVENDRNTLAGELVACIAGLGYRMYWHTPPLYNPANFMKREENAFGEIASLNLLCLPDGGRWRPEDFAEIEGFSPEPLDGAGS
ncbi:MAG: FkbM family methyltransferase [Candidatus Eisenbacteria bacterium]|nr:FkbM family methyltransferase [Candidatus Eisenbacteria bacterium]